MNQSTVRVAAVQMAASADRATNVRRIDDRLRQAADAGAQLVLLQELHNDRYFCQTEDPDNFDLAESIPGPGTEHLGVRARQLRLVIVASLFERRAAGLYHNTAVVLDSDGSLAGRYRKMHIPDDPGYHEKFYFTPGDLGFQPLQTRIGKLGVLVCWDQWYPEAARLMTLGGADLLLYPTAIGWDSTDDEAEQQRQLDAWVTVQRAHAITNGVPVIVCNRTGHEAHPRGETSGIRFWGNSFMTGPQGEVLARAAANEEILLLADIDLKRSEQVRRAWPFLRDRRIDSYHDLTRRFRD